MIRVATTIIAHGTANVLGHGVQVADQVVDGFASQLVVAFQGGIELGNIGGMMFAMMDFHRLRINVRLERIMRIRKFG